MSDNDPEWSQYELIVLIELSLVSTQMFVDFQVNS